MFYPLTVQDFLDRAAPVVGGWFASLPDAFVDAMDDDLGTPAAVAVIHDSVREGNRLLADGPSEALGQKFGEVIAMLDVLGLNPADEAWASGASDDRLTELAADAGADVGDCIADGTYLGWATATTEYAAAELERLATPTVVLDGEVVTGAEGGYPSAEELQAAVDAALATGSGG